MKIEDFLRVIGIDFFAGVPDSQLKALCNWLLKKYGVDGVHHQIGANEGNCMALAAGYYLATGKVPLVYMQNSGLGNVINPLASLMNREVYGIPCVMVIGWRGEPGVHDEPQHVFQGKVTPALLNAMGIKTFIIRKDTSVEEVKTIWAEWQAYLNEGNQVAFLVSKGALEYDEVKYSNAYDMTRETAISHILDYTGDDIIVSTTGKASRELFELREKHGEGHEKDFLTVGSMGHASSIALGIAMQKQDKRVWCIDGDGAALMHMGAMGMIGSRHPNNFVHVVINNCAHESVGGQPTTAPDVDLCGVAESCGYEIIEQAKNKAELKDTLKKISASRSLAFLEVKCAIGARKNLGRPTVSPTENKRDFMNFLG